MKLLMSIQMVVSLIIKKQLKYGDAGKKVGYRVLNIMILLLRECLKTTKIEINGKFALGCNLILL